MSYITLAGLHGGELSNFAAERLEEHRREYDEFLKIRANFKEHSITDNYKDIFAYLVTKGDLPLSLFSDYLNNKKYPLFLTERGEGFLIALQNALRDKKVTVEEVKTLKFPCILGYRSVLNQEEQKREDEICIQLLNDLIASKEQK